MKKWKILDSLTKNEGAVYLAIKDAGVLRPQYCKYLKCDPVFNQAVQDLGEAKLDLAGWKARLDRPAGDKEFRAEPLAAQVEVGNLYLKTGDWNRDFLEEMEYFPHSEYKDQIDAASAAFAQLNKKRIVIGAF